MIHPAVYSLGGHIEVMSEAPESELEFNYFQLKDADPSEPIRKLLWIVDTHFGILSVFEEILGPVIAHDPARWRRRETLWAQESRCKKQSGGPF
jgi:hypothetical protein